jgi:Cdc6-like AAA superfamily ATPase
MDRKIIVNADVLLRTYVPERLLHREKELQQIKNNIENRVNTIMFGPVGSGKTSLIKRVIKDLATEDIRYVDCTIYDTAFSVLKETLHSASLVFQRSNYELIKRLAKEARQKRLWFCFDDFVRLKDTNIITKVMSLGINVTLVSNVKRDVNILNTNVLSNIPCIVKLPSYNTDQSFDILKERARKALAKSSFTDELLMEISERTRGNMALAINVLRTAALEAQSEKKNRIDITDLMDTLNPASNSRKLGKDESVLLEILGERKQLASGELFSLYKKRATSSKGERSFRNYMENLCTKGFVRAVGTNRWRVYEFIKSDENMGLETP